MTAVKVSVPEELLSWLERQVVSGRYVDESDYIIHLIRESKAYNEGLQKMTTEIEYGLQSPEIDLGIDDVWREAKDRVHERRDYGQR